MSDRLTVSNCYRPYETTLTRAKRIHCILTEITTVNCGGSKIWNRFASDELLRSAL